MAPTFDTIQRDADSQSLVRKVQKAVAFLAPKSVALPTSLFASGSLIDLKAAGWLPVGMVTPDGFSFGREVESEAIDALGYSSPVRSDVTTVPRSITFTALEKGRKHMLELVYGTDLTAVTQDQTTGEIIFDEPDLPVNSEYRFLVIGSDGPAAENWVMGKGFGRVKLSAGGAEAWGREGAVSSEITLDVFTDDALGVPVRHYLGGTGALAYKDVLGFTATPGTAPAAWAASTTYTVGTRVTLTGGAVLEATVAGTSGTTQPTAPATVGGTVVDGTVTWQRIS